MGDPSCPCKYIVLTQGTNKFPCKYVAAKIYALQLHRPEGVFEVILEFGNFKVFKTRVQVSNNCCRFCVWSVVAVEACAPHRVVGPLRGHYPTENKPCRLLRRMPWKSFSGTPVVWSHAAQITKLVCHGCSRTIKVQVIMNVDSLI